MRRIAVPAIGPDALYDRVAAARAGPARPRVVALRPAVLAAYAAYGPTTGAVVSLEPIAVSPKDAQVLSRNYEALAGATFPDVRPAVLRANAGRCALCDHGKAGEIDHYLPRSAYPEFSVHPHNLVPACHRCNHTKGAALRRPDGTPAFLHAYLDPLPDAQFLRVDVEIGPGVFPRYSVVRCDGMDEETFATLCSHVERLGLAELYADEAISHLSENAGAYRVHHELGGAAAVAERLAADAASVYEHFGTRNHWKVALLDALSRTGAFCDGGFALLGVADVA